MNDSYIADSVGGRMLYRAMVILRTLQLIAMAIAIGAGATFTVVGIPWLVSRLIADLSDLTEATQIGLTAAVFAAWFLFLGYAIRRLNLGRS